MTKDQAIQLAEAIDNLIYARAVFEDRRQGAYGEVLGQNIEYAKGKLREVLIGVASGSKCES